MKPWNKLTNDELALHLELWLNLDGRVSDKNQRDFFDEITWRLRLTKEEDERREA